jgi:uncharacterized membrane protein
MTMFGAVQSGVWHSVLQATAAMADPQGWNMWTAITTFINTPAPFSPFGEYLAVLFFLWLLARRNHRRLQQGDFGKQAQEVLDTRHATGELSEKAYHKYRQDVALRPRR